MKKIAMVGASVLKNPKGPIISVDNRTVYPLNFHIREERGNLYIIVESREKADNTGPTN